VNRFKWLWPPLPLVVLATIFAFISFSVKTVNAATTIPLKVNFQGRLTDSNGNAVADGSYNMKFTLYDAITSGTNRWQENRQTTNRVTVTNGLFSIQLGDVTALSPTLFSTYADLWLEVELPTPASATCSTASCGVYTEGPLSPRQKLAASAHAFNADTVDGIDGATLAVKNSDNNFTASQTITGTLTATTLSASTLQTASGDLTINPTGNTIIYGSANTAGTAALDVRNSTSGYLLYVGNDGFVNIGGDITGAATLEVNGDFATKSDDYSAYYSSGETYGYSRTVSVSSSDGRYEIGAYDGTGASNGGRKISLNPLGGNVGINTISPAYQLDVNGDINIASGSALRIGGSSICTSSGCTGGGGGSYVNLQASTPGTAQTGHLNISGTGIFGGSLQAGSNSAIGNSVSADSGIGLNVDHTFSSGCPVFTICSAINGAAKATANQALLSGVQGGTALPSGSPTVGRSHAFWATDSSITSGTITNNYGLYIENMQSGTNDYGVYINGADTYALWVDSGESRFDGQVTIGESNTTGTLLVLDTDTDSTEPSGTDGAMYYNNAMEQFRCFRDGSWESCATKPIDRAYIIEEEFISGATAATSANTGYGNFNWINYTIGGTTCSTYSYGGGTSGSAISDDRPGIVKFTTGGTANTGCRLLLGSTSDPTVVLSSGIYIKSSVAVNSAANHLMRVGLDNQVLNVGQSSTAGVWWEADTSANANWRYCYANGTASATCANSSTAIAANTFVRLEILITGTGSGTSAATFKINGSSHTVSGATFQTGNARPDISCATLTAASKQCYADYFFLKRDASSQR
jgi:hypothetical protein